MKHLLLLVFVLILAFPAFSQITLSGSVLDEEHQPVKSAYILVLEDKKLSTSTNEHGEFVFTLPPGTYTFRVSAMNFGTDEFEVIMISDTSDVVFQLFPQSLELEEYIFTDSGEDPGIRKMRKVIEKRSVHASHLKTLESDVYLKGNLKILELPQKILGQELTESEVSDMGLDSNRQGIIYLVEQHTKYYFEQPDKTFSKIQSVRTSGNPQGLGFAKTPPIINIYENNVNILEGLSPRGIISPASSNALYYYHFKLEHTFNEGDKLISKIKVTPKRKFEPLFSGYVYVVEDDWIFHSLELEIDRSTGIELLDSLRFTQTYYNYEGENWIIQNQTIEPMIRVLGIKIGGTFLSHYAHNSINTALPSDIFGSKFVSIYDSTALDKDSVYWNQNRKIPLSEAEQMNFIKNDSLILKLQETADSVTSHKGYWSADILTLLNGGLSYNSPPHLFHLNGLIDMVNFNNVEGLNFTLKPEYTFINKHRKSSLNLKSNLRYGITSEKMYYSLHGKWQKQPGLNADNNYTLKVSAGRYIRDISQLMPVYEIYNTFSALSGLNLLNFYERDYVSLDWEHNLGNGFRYIINGSYEDRSPLENLTSYTWFNQPKDKLSSNHPEGLPAFAHHKATVLSVTAEYQPGWKYIRYPKSIGVIKSQAPVFSVTYTKGIKGLLGSDVDFDKFSLNVNKEFNMKLIGDLRVNAGADGFLNKRVVGNPDLIHYTGNRIWLAGPYLNTFQMAGYYELSHQRNYMVKLNAEWHLNGFISNKVPLFKRLNWHFVLGNNTLFHSPKQYYSEWSFGIENIGYNIYRLGRVDVVMRYDSWTKDYSYGLKIGFGGALFSVKPNSNTGKATME